ncbi:serine hydrolase domain-containing protein [Mucilaginibacter conchicola]|uniref:serine hydrolase domain-containing protein n=1 Tax=Mucilaginibacter conchicola TaxID=2303333 RepID=UPI001314F7E8|nr:serine hydrolase domain-containing protein [Mucilaginibacter conchicola]
MKRSRKILFLFITLLLIVIQYSCRSVTALNGKKVSAYDIDHFIKKQVDTFRLPSVSIAFIDDGKIVYHNEFGYSNLKNKSKADRNSIYEACSMSKPVFAYFIMKMKERGIINIDTPLYKYLPYPEIEYDGRNKLITARMLLSHTSGLPNWHEYEPADSALHVAKGAQYLKFNPGTAYNYSGEGYQYLVNVIAHLLHTDLKSLSDTVDKEVCKPLGMKHAYFGWNKYVAQHKVTGYRQNEGDGSNKPGKLKKFEEFSAAGGLHTNAIDYANFIIALMDEKGLSKKSFKEMFEPQIKVPDSDEADDWGLGLAIKKTNYGIRYMHSGNNGDFTGYFVMYKDLKRGFVFLTNCNRAGDLFDALMPLFENGG